eukprot:6491288-Amphidinium_carterae.7
MAIFSEALEQESTDDVVKLLSALPPLNLCKLPALKKAAPGGKKDKVHDKDKVAGANFVAKDKVDDDKDKVEDDNDKVDDDKDKVDHDKDKVDNDKDKVDDDKDKVDYHKDKLTTTKTKLSSYLTPRGKCTK